MKLTIQGQGDVTLTQRDFVAAGGQGHQKGQRGYAESGHRQESFLMLLHKKR